MPVATLGTMRWGDYWKRNCAPKMMARKKELGRGVSEREIAAYVEEQTGKPSERALIGHWLHGRREPFFSQFLALCEKLEMDPHEVLRGKQEQRTRIPLAATQEMAPSYPAVGSVKKPLRRTKF